jgi:Zn-dependent alcohol dehydrogenase
MLLSLYRVGATHVLTPQDVADHIAKHGQFDTCIEVSGNYRALQSAIDSTGELSGSF